MRETEPRGRCEPASQLGQSSVTEPRALAWAPLPDLIVVDADALAAAVPRDTTTIKRIFADMAMQLVATRVSPSEILTRAQVDLSGRQPFDDIPWHDYFRVAVVVAELLRGPEQLGAGLREVGRCFYRGLLGTVVGQMLLGRHLGEAIRKAADLWQDLNTVGAVWSEFRSEREFDYHFAEHPYMLIESVGIGIFEGVFAHHHMPVDLQIARPAPNHTVVRIRW